MTRNNVHDVTAAGENLIKIGKTRENCLHEAHSTQKKLIMVYGMWSQGIKKKTWLRWFCLPFLTLGSCFKSSFLEFQSGREKRFLFLMIPERKGHSIFATLIDLHDADMRPLGAHRFISILAGRDCPIEPSLGVEGQLSFTDWLSITGWSL